MASKIIIDLGFKTYEITAEDEEFAAAVNKHLATLKTADGRVSPRRLFGEYVKLCAQIRNHQKELYWLKKERERMLKSLGELEEID